jgi:hypothetical protein
MRTVKSRQSQPTMYMYNGCTIGPSLYRLVHVPHCIGLLALLTLPLTYEECWGEKGKLICLLPRLATIRIDCRATSDVSLSMLEHVQSIHKHSMYSMISMMTAILLQHLATDVTSVLN